MELSPRGVELLVKKGVDVWEAETGHTFPYNWGVWLDGLYNGCRNEKVVSLEEGELVLQRASKFRDWIKSAASYGTLRKMLMASISENGVGSPRTRINPVEFSKRFTSPARADKLLWKTRKQAEDLFTQFGVEGAPSWSLIAAALMRNTRPRRAAIIATALFLDGWNNSCYDDWNKLGYREAVTWLQMFRNSRFSETYHADHNADDNGMYAEDFGLDPKPMLEEGETKVFQLKRTHEYGSIEFLCLVQSPGLIDYVGSRGSAEDAMLFNPFSYMESLWINEYSMVVDHTYQHKSEVVHYRPSSVYENVDYTVYICQKPCSQERSLIAVHKDGRAFRGAFDGPWMEPSHFIQKEVLAKFCQKSNEAFSEEVAV